MSSKILIIEDFKNKLSMSLKMTTAALLIANSLNVLAHQENTNNLEMPEQSNLIEIHKKQTIINDYKTFIQEKQNGIHNTGFGEVTFVFSLQNQEMLLKNLKHTYGISDTAPVEYAISPQSGKKQPEIHFMRVSYGENKYLKIIKYDQGFESGSDTDKKNFEDYEKFKDGFSHYETLEKNFEDFVVIHELFHSPEFIWSKLSTVREFFADYGSILTVGINKDLSYNEVNEMLLENRIKRKRYFEKTKQNSHYSEELFEWHIYKKIIPTEEEYKKLKEDYKKYEKNADTPYNFIANYVAERMNPFIEDENQKIKTNFKI